MSKKITSEHIKALLQDRFSDGDRTLIAFEVSNGTGSAANRWADAVSMELWPSNNYNIVGYEIKVSRSDWLSELKQPEKSHAISRFCDQFYLVAPNGILKVDELPKGWGYMQASQASLRIKARAPKRDAESPDRPFIASFMRKAIEKYADKDMIRAQYDKAKSEERKYWEDHFKDQLNRYEEKHEKHKALVDGFESRSGIKLDTYSYLRTADAIRALQNRTDREKLIFNLERQIAMQTTLRDQNKKSLEALKEWPEEK